MPRCFESAVATSILSVFAFSALAQPTHDQKLTSSDPHVSQQFGSAVDVAGSLALIGARGDDPQFNSVEYGAAFVLRFDGTEWKEEQKLVQSEPAMLDLFGKSVAISTADGSVESTWLLVGMSGDPSIPSNAGAVAAFRHSGAEWVQEALLTASDGASGDNFGYALSALDGHDLIIWQRGIVGAPRHNLSGFNREGAAYLFRVENGNWVEEAKLTASDAGPAANFGQSVAISGDRVLVGAPSMSVEGAGGSAGAAYVFEYDGSRWNETAKLTASDAASFGQFGYALALEGDRALIGAPGDREAGNSAGAVYSFRFDGQAWNEEQKLMAPEDPSGGRFGEAVAFHDEQAVIGAPFWAEEGAGGKGGAFRFSYDAAALSWSFVDRMLPDDLNDGAHFGAALAIDKGIILAAAPDDNLPIPGTGGVYAYGKPTATSAERPDPAEALSAAALQNYPNPFRDQTTLSYETDRPGRVTLTIYDVLGRRLHTLVDAERPAGQHRVTWDGRDESGRSVPAGPYFARLRTDEVVRTRNLMVLK